MLSHPPPEPSVSDREKFLVTTIIGFGFFVRLSEFLANRSIWLDEAMLALNVLHKSFWQLIVQPLDHYQAAPIGFLLLTKSLITVLGAHDYVFRVIPFLSGLASFLLFYKLLRRYVSVGAALGALVLFSASTEMTRYATEFKPYSSDILVALIIMYWGTKRLTKTMNMREALIGGAIGAVSLWFSFPAVFVLGGVGISLILFYLRNGRWPELKVLGVSLLAWSISLAAVYVVSLRGIETNAGLVDYWVDSFMPLPPRTLADAQWTLGSFVYIFCHPGMIEHWLIGLMSFFLGIFVIAKKGTPWLLLMLLMSLLLAAIASSLHRYPFSGRFLLFYVPFLYLIIFAGVSFLIERPKSALGVLGIGVLGILLFWPLQRMYKQLVYRDIIYRQEIKPVLNYVRKNIQPGDTIYVYYGAEPAFSFYAETYGLDKMAVIRGINSRSDWDKYAGDLSQLHGKKRAWIIFSHILVIDDKTEEEVMLDYLDSKGTMLGGKQDIDAAAYLYDLSNS